MSVNYKLVDLELEEVVIQTHETGVHDPSRIHQKKLAAKPIVVALDAIGKWHPVIYGKSQKRKTAKRFKFFEKSKENRIYANNLLIMLYF